jgi:hypothetical protein
MELTGGQADGAEPEGQLAGVVGKISTDSGVKVQLASLGRPEQERVTNMGDVRAALSSGTTVTAIVPDWPAVTESGSVEGVTGASERVKLGVALAWAETLLAAEAEPRCDASPA